MVRKRTSTRVSQNRRRARREILETARAVLKKGGMAALTLGSVAGELGMTKQAIYHYFPSKEALVRALVTELLDEEIEFLVNAVESEKDPAKVLGTLIRAFHSYYADRLDAFRIVYCELQLVSPSAAIDAATLTEQVHPRTRRLFDTIEAQISGSTRSAAKRRHKRRLAFTAWTSALGLMTMISVAHANNDPLAQPHDALLDTLCQVFDMSAS
jgi:AcrR family transcriptional regulator